MTSNTMEQRRSELLADVEKQVSAIATEYRIDEDIAEQLGCAIANHLAEHWGGQHITFPKEHHFRVAKRDLEIYEQFDGRNHHRLGEKYNLCTRTIYKIIKRVRAKGDPNQIQLF